MSHVKEIEKFKKNIKSLELDIKQKQEKIIKVQESKEQLLNEMKQEKQKHESKINQL